MKFKNLLFGIFSFVSVCIYGQSAENKVTATTNAVTEYSIKTINIEELKNVDWDAVKDIFKDNEKDQVIKLAFEYANPSEKRNSKPDIKNFKFEVSGTTEELPGLIEKSKGMILKIVKINDSYN